MKILIASGERRMREAGAAGVVIYHAEGLQNLGHQVETWFAEDVLPQRRWPSRFKELEFAAGVSRKIRKDPSRFDVVNIHAPWGGIYGFSRNLFPTAELPPYVFTMHGIEQRYVLAMRLEDKKGRATHFGWKNRLWHRLYHQKLYDLSISRADCGAVVNREGWIFSELKYGHPPGRIWYVPNGVEKDFFLEREFQDAPAHKLLFVGSWIDRKGIYYLAEAFAKLTTRMPELTLTIAGCGVPEDAVKKDFPEGVRQKVVVIPKLGRADMPRLYATHDVFVFPSLMEGMPLSLLEAMATGMPVVTTNTCGMADVVEHGVNGWLVTPANSREFECAVETVCNDSQLRKRLGLAGQRAMQQQTWDLVARKMEHVLRTAVETKERAG
jgi:glycosyltransferase involved in cell wall biosynthesis